MQPTYTEIVNSQIMEQFEAINNDTETINWYEQYKDTCDKVITGMYSRRSTETDLLNYEQKNCWHHMPKFIREQLLDMIRALFDSRIYSSGPTPIEYVVKNAKRCIPIREKIIEKLRIALSSHKILLLLTVSIDELQWKNLSDNDKNIVKKCWVDLAILTIELNKSVFYVNSNSQDFWKNLTKKWIEEENIQL